jgi:hypothetical protein
LYSLVFNSPPLVFVFDIIEFDSLMFISGQGQAEGVVAHVLMVANDIDVKELAIFVGPGGSVKEVLVHGLITVVVVVMVVVVVVVLVVVVLLFPSPVFVIVTLVSLSLKSIITRSRRTCARCVHVYVL